jgi:Flp pilus assembly protein TadB
MSGAITATTVLAATAAAGTAYSIQQGRKAEKAQARAAEQATAQANKQADLADQANNRANKKRPNVAGMLDANQQSAGGAGGTMLTGPAGIDIGSLTLGKNTLLGQ